MEFPFKRPMFSKFISKITRPSERTSNNIALLSLSLSPFVISLLLRLIGQGTVPLADVIRAGTIKRRVVQLANPQGVPLEAVCFHRSIRHVFVHCSVW